jgi:hypothetical protein
MITPSFVLLFSAVSALCAEPASPADLAAARAAAKANFLSHAQGAPTVDSAARLPAEGDASLVELRAVLQSAREIQLGCVLPCSQLSDALVYKGKVELVGAGLGLNAQETAAAVKRYVPDGKPRLRPADYPQGAVPAGDKLIEGKVLERLIADGRISGQLREGMTRRALALADALGTTSLIDGAGAPAGGPGAGYGPSSGASRTMTAEQIAALNAIPRAQAESLRKRAEAPPPPPAVEALKNETGLIARARAHWDAIGENPRTSEVGRMGAATMVAFLEAFNLDKFENSAFELSQSAADPGASRWQVAKDAGAVAGNGFLAAAGFIPASAWAKVAQVTKVSDAAAWTSGKVASIFRGKPPMSPEVTSRLAALEQKALTTPLTKEEVAWMGQASGGKSNIVVHTTTPESMAKIRPVEANEVLTAEEIAKRGRVAATTESFVYGSRRVIASKWDQIRSGVPPKDALVVFQGQASQLFAKHEVTGVYSWMKSASQVTTNGTGDIIIVRAQYDATTQVLSVLEARMATAADGTVFMLNKWPKTRLWGRRVLLDPFVTSAAGFVPSAAVASATGGNIFEYVLGAPGR